MALDTNGIWQYQETDAEATASDLLNLLADSTSDKVADLMALIANKQNVLGDTGWVDIAINSGFAAQGSSNKPQVRRIGKVVYARWGWSSNGMTSTNTGYDVGVVPVGFRPVNGTCYGLAVGDSSNRSGQRITISTGGNINILTGSSLSGYYLFNSGFSWVLD